MTYLSITKWLMILGVVILIGWELIAKANTKDGDTIVEMLDKATEKYPMITFLLGFLMGHFFWSR